MAKPIVAIVGRPNVGKSQLFNRLAGKRLSIVEDTPGVTRDRLYADSDWRGRDFTVIDTGGIEPSNDNEILQFMRLQAETAISHADVIILITDLRTGVTAADQDVASMLLRSGKPIVLAVNKCDKPGDPPAEFYEFYNLGLGEPFGISALHGYGVNMARFLRTSAATPRTKNEKQTKGGAADAWQESETRNVTKPGGYGLILAER